MLVAVVTLFLVFSCTGAEKKEALTKHKFERIISLSPSVTETLFALGLGNNVVGRTRFCNYPPEARKIKEVGGYIDPNYEAIVMLKPDVVILLPEQEKVKKYLKQVGIRSLQVNNKSVDDILTAIKIIGDSCSAKERAGKLLAELKEETEQIKKKTQNLTKPKVLVSIGRTMGTGTLKEVYVAGEKTYFGELISIAGGENVLNKISASAYPVLSAEGIIHLNPDIIIELVPDLQKLSVTKEEVINEWKRLGNISAVKNNMIKIIPADYSVVPGPRFILLLKDFAKIIHPELEWKN